MLSNTTLLASMGWLLQSILLFGLTLLVLPLLHRRPTLRHNLLVVAFSIALLLPLLQAVPARLAVPLLPAVTVSSSPGVSPGVAKAVPGEAPGPRSGDLTEGFSNHSPVSIEHLADENVQAAPTDFRSGQAPVVPAPASTSKTSWLPNRDLIANAFVAVWCTGATLCLFILINQFRIVAGIRSRARSLRDTEIGERLKGLLLRRGWKNDISLLEAEEISVPFVMGVWKPAVLLPPQWRDWSDEEAQLVLEHELEHIARYDVHKQIFARFVASLHWCNPFAWMSLARLRVERELSVDLLVSQRTEKRSEYATLLLALAKQQTHPPVALGISMASRSYLRTRIEAIVAPQRESRMVGRGSMFATLLLFIGFFTSIGLLDIGPADFNGGEALGQTSPTTAPQDSEVSATNAKETMIRGRIVAADTGEPIATAKVLVVSFDGRFTPLKEQHTTLAEGACNANGEFEVRYVLDDWNEKVVVNIIAYDAKHAIDWVRIKEDKLGSPFDFSLQANEPSTFRFTLEGEKPPKSVRPLISSLHKHDEIDIRGGRSAPVLSLSRSASERIFGELQSNEEGILSFYAPSKKTGFSMQIEGDDIFAKNVFQFHEVFETENGMMIRGRGAFQSISLSVKTKEYRVPLERSRLIQGRVLLGDGETPSPHTMIRMDAEKRWKWGRTTLRTYSETDAEGRFRIHPWPGDYYNVMAFPPSGTSYMAIQFERPVAEIENDPDFTVRLQKGRVLSGVVRRSENDLPIPGVSIHFYPYDAEDFDICRELTIKTNADGTFHLPTPPIRGWLVVQAPAKTYLMKEYTFLTEQQQRGGMPYQEMYRFRNHAVIEIESGDISKPDMDIRLDTGGVVTATVVDADNVPVEDAIVWHALYPIHPNRSWSGVNEWALLVKKGEFTFPGLTPGRDYEVILLDPVRKIGAVGTVNTERPNPTFQLLPCGKARLKYLDDSEKPRVNYAPPEFNLRFNDGFRDEKSPLSQDLLGQFDDYMLTNLDPLNHFQNRETDENGWLTLEALVPGAPYTYDRRVGRGGRYPVVLRVKPGETVEIEVRAAP